LTSVDTNAKTTVEANDSPRLRNQTPEVLRIQEDSLLSSYAPHYSSHISNKNNLGKVPRRS